MGTPEKTNLICEPAETDHRFILGHKGENNLLVIALNPNTASGNKHDSTTRNIERIANEHGYDGWVLFNLSPVRDPKPENLIEEADIGLQQENLNHFYKTLSDKSWNIKNVWLAWGNGVIKRIYLTDTAVKMLDYLNEMDLNYYCIKRTQQHHPYHSAQRVLNSFFKKGEKIEFENFPAQAYKELILKYDLKNL
jgi:hypothetical protein